MSTPQQPNAYVDIPSTAELFADSVRFVSFSDGMWHFEFTVNRMQELKPPAPPVVMAFPSCRLVLTAAAGIALLNQLTQLVGILEQQGTIKRNDPPAPPVVAPPSKTSH